MTLPEFQVVLKGATQQRLQTADLDLDAVVMFFLTQEEGRALHEPTVLVVPLPQDQGAIYLFSDPSSNPLRVLMGDAQDLVDEGILTQAELDQRQVAAEIAQHGSPTLH